VQFVQVFVMGARLLQGRTSLPRATPY